MGSIKAMEFKNYKNFRVYALHLILFCMILLPLNGTSHFGNNKDKSGTDSLIKRHQNEWKRSISGSFNTQTKYRFDSLEIGRFLRQYPKFYQFEDHIRLFYDDRKMAYVWFDKTGLIEQAGNLANWVMNFKSRELAEEIPYFQTLDSLMYGSGSVKFSGAKKNRLELMLTAHYFALSERLTNGINPQILSDIDWNLPKEKPSYPDYLKKVLNRHSVRIKDGNSQIVRQYELLKTYLKKYRDLDEKGSWFEIKSGNKSFRLGDSSEVIRQIKLRLSELGDLKDVRPDRLFDQNLENVVKQFQIRHGIKDDGIIGRETIFELNVPYNKRIRQLLVNMERCRWVPENLSTDYLAVNIPEFKLHVFSNDSLKWSCKVVVGKVMNKTAIFNADLKYIVFSPYWNVPQSIVKNEILKDLRRDRNYLRKHNMEITGYRNGLPEIRQRPGLSNALGLVKFVFPNIYSIYLHDTPSKSLFNEHSRAFSHGCIRVSEPFKLAQFLLRNDPEWNDEKIDAAMNSGIEKYISLKDKVPVFIVYFTAFVDSEGIINFRKDIYGRDKRFSDMIIDFQ
jgi:murein L,D-transpeptidase YcbB/YkuD